MKQEQQQQAQHLYYQTDLSKSQIAETVGISRRTLHYWIDQNNWERIKKNATHIPSLLADNCYRLMGDLMDEILSEDRVGKPVTPQEASTIYKLTLTIGKLKNRGTLTENMELFGWLLDSIAAKNPQLATEVQPYISSYIHTRDIMSSRDYRENLEHTPHGDSLSFGEGRGEASRAEEDKLDFADHLAWAQNGFKEETATQPQPATPTPDALRTTAPRTPSTPPTQRPVEKVSTEKFSDMIRKQLRGTSTTGPCKNLKQKPVAA
jgi:predicted DNA-binding protein YlxM (UPF0122 family)